MVLEPRFQHKNFEGTRVTGFMHRHFLNKPNGELIQCRLWYVLWDQAFNKVDK